MRAPHESPTTKAPFTSEFMKHAFSGAPSPNPHRRLVHMIWSVYESVAPQPTQRRGTTGWIGAIVCAFRVRRRLT